MLTETKGIGHLNDKFAEEIQVACGEYDNITLASGRFIVTRVQQKRPVLLIYWVKD